MRYLQSQSYHTLQHWQSTKRSAIYTSYLKRYTGFFIDGALDEAGDLCIFPWSWHEEDAIEGDTWSDGSGVSDKAWYIQPSLSLVKALRWTTEDEAYDVYFILYKAGTVSLVPQSVPFAAESALTAPYYTLEHKDGELYIDTSGAPTDFIFDASYTGKVLIPTIARYKAYFDFYDHGASPASMYDICKDAGSIGGLAYHTKWNFDTVYAVSAAIGAVYDPDILSQVPRLTGLTLIHWGSLLSTYGSIGCVQGGCNAKDDDTLMYRAGLGSTIGISDARRMPYIATGMTSGRSRLAAGAYSAVLSDDTLQQVSHPLIGSCALCGDYGRNPGTGGSPTYWPQAASYNNNFYKFGYARNADDGISTIIRRITDVKVQEGFKFFT